MSSCTRSVRGSTNRGFTLVELLVVISIISMLMSITLPALNGAREQGKRIACQANLRNLIYGWMMYATDNEDNICSADTDWDVPPAAHWVADGPVIPGNDVGGTLQAVRNGVFWPYTERTIELYKCKSDPSDLLRSYAISRAMNGPAGDPGSDPITVFRSQGQISMPTDRIVFVDADSATRWIDGAFFPLQGSGDAPPSWAIRNSHNVTARHGKGFNASFADGHCEYYRYRDHRTVALANWEIGSAKASPDNRDIERVYEFLGGRTR